MAITKFVKDYHDKIFPEYVFSFLETSPTETTESDGSESEMPSDLETEPKSGKTRVVYYSATGNTEEELEMKPEEVSIFPVGGKNDAFAKYFVGQSYLNMLTTDSVAIGNVTFEPGCRNNWHIHHAKKGGGQILLCTAGRGYYQEWGKAARELHPGDVVVIPAGVKHWHGAAPDSWFAHLAVEIPGEETSTEWCEPVSGREYGTLK